MRPFVPTLLLVCLVATPALVAAPTTQPGETVTLVYDINDLTRPRNNYPVGAAMARGTLTVQPGMAVDGMGTIAVLPAPEGVGRDAFVGQLMSLIQETIDPQSWRDSGGQTGSMRELAGQLVITQTKPNQEQIRKLLTEMRQQQGPAQMTCVRAYWMTLDAHDIAVVFDMRKKEGAGAMPTIPDGLIGEEKLYCQGQTICFNGQTVHITSGRQWSVVSKLNPVVGSNAVGYDPTLSVANSGVTLQVTPQIVPDSDSAILDLRSTVTETRGPTDALEFSQPPSTQPTFRDFPIDARIDRINIVNQEFATTVRLPLGKKVLLGGMTLEPASKTDPGRQLYLVVEVDAVK